MIRSYDIFWPDKNPMGLKSAEEAVIKRIPRWFGDTLYRKTPYEEIRAKRYLFGSYLQFLSVGILPRINYSEGKMKMSKNGCCARKRAD